jgi:hypothetical protein
VTRLVTTVTIMKTVKSVLVLGVFVLGAAASASALAWHHGGHARFGVYIGAPAYWYPPYYAPYYPAYPYPPVVVAPSAPPIYIEQGGGPPASAPSQPQAATQSSSQSNWWYYCTDAQAYYPYVKECPAGWQRVAPQP